MPEPSRTSVFPLPIWAGFAVAALAALDLWRQVSAPIAEISPTQSLIVSPLVAVAIAGGLARAASPAGLWVLALLSTALFFRLTGLAPLELAAALGLLAAVWRQRAALADQKLSTALAAGWGAHAAAASVAATLRLGLGQAPTDWPWVLLWIMLAGIGAAAIILPRRLAAPRIFATTLLALLAGVALSNWVTAKLHLLAIAVGVFALVLAWHAFRRRRQPTEPPASTRDSPSSRNRVRT